MFSTLLAIPRIGSVPDGNAVDKSWPFTSDDERLRPSALLLPNSPWDCAEKICHFKSIKEPHVLVLPHPAQHIHSVNKSKLNLEPNPQFAARSECQRTRVA